MQDSEEIKKRVCLHCSTELRKNQNKFCCIGCEFVYQSIGKLGLENFYRVRIESDANSAEQVLPNRNYEYLDNPEIFDKFTVKINDTTSQVSFYLPTIHCSACVWLLEQLPKAVDGVLLTRVSYQESKILITYNLEKISLIEIARVLNSIGYPPVPAEESIQDRVNKNEDKKALIRIGISAVAAFNTMMFSDALVESYFSGIEDKYLILFTWISALLTFPVVTYCAYPFYRMALGSLIIGAIHLDLPISLAIIISYLKDLHTVFTGGSQVYFDSITCLVFLLLISRYIQKKAVYSSRASINTTWDLFPANVKVKNEYGYATELLNNLKVGDIVLVAPGERIPSDGVVVTGVSTLDTSFLTGESKPNEVQKNSIVLGGSLNIDGNIEVKITEIGNKTRLGKIISQISFDRTNKTKLETLVDDFSKYFVFIILALAILTYAIWYFIEPESALTHTIALLVITCPCALGLAIPATVTVALAQAQKNKLYIKNSESLDILTKSKNFYFDKTGTLTSGKLEVIECYGNQSYLANAVELAGSTVFHPICNAIYQKYEDELSKNLHNISHLPAKGVQALNSNNEIVILGSYKYLEEISTNFSSEFKNKIADNLSLGLSVSILAVNKIAELIFILDDKINPEALIMIQQLKSDNKNIFILSGDSSLVVNKLAEKLEIDKAFAFGDLYPEQKSEIIRKDSLINVMVGDGINDALAMKAADLAIGLKGGIESTLECADIFIANSGLNGFLNCYNGAKEVQKVIKRNLYFSIFYNLIGATAAIFGYVTPLIASIMMPISSFTVILSSVMANYFKKNKWI